MALVLLSLVLHVQDLPNTPRPAATKALFSAFLFMYLTAIFCQTQLYEGPLKNGQTTAC